jgi:Na+-translocating ferredoxin:NAD+ oxidoreductase subunit G
MKKKEMFAGIIVMFAIALLSGYLLSQVFRITRAHIEKQKKIEAERLNKEMFPDGVDFVDAEKQGLSYTSVFDAEKNQLGMIFEFSRSGYSGPIVIKVGIDKNLQVKGVRILGHNETPGLGAKITDNKFLNQFNGKTGNELGLKKYYADGTIDAVTGATISSKAVSEGIMEMMEKVGSLNITSSPHPDLLPQGEKEIKGGLN